MASALAATLSLIARRTYGVHRQHRGHCLHRQSQRTSVYVRALNCERELHWQAALALLDA
jgi:hypothetical protein